MSTSMSHAQARPILALCTSGSEFIVVLLLGWLPTNAEEFSFHYYLTHRWEGS